MPRAATSGELDLLRSDGQASKLYAAFFVPHVIYSAQLSSVPSTTDQVAEIAFGSGSGTLANVKPDMLLKIGSTAGGQELGIARIRKAPIAGTFYIGEQSIINWGSVTPVYLTVVDDFDLWAKHVRIDGTTIYMDYEIAFSDQHTTFSPVPVLGPVVTVGKLTGASVTVQLGPETDYASWVIGSSISTYLWSCATADSFSSTSAVRPTATFSTAGWHLVYCTVTAANSKTRQGMRYVYIWSDASPPLTVFGLNDFVEDHKQGGINFSLTFSDSAPLSTIPDRSLCVLFAEDYYGTGDDQEQTSIGAVTGRENVVGIGRLIAESLAYDEETQTASLEIQGYQELMKRIHGFPTGLRFKITPEVWTDMPSMTVDRALYHLLEYHTTAVTIMDINITGDTRFTAQAFSPFSTIWEQMREFAEKQIFANTRIDHLGRLWFEIDPLLTPVADRDYPIVMTLADGDLTGRVDLPREVLSDVGQINLSGVVIDCGGNATAFFSLSPGHIHDRTGRVETADRLLLQDQTQANALAGLLFGAKNNPYKPMRIKLRANNRLITCFPNQAVTYTVSAANNPRGFAITKNWIPRQRKLSYDPETGQLSIELVIEAETIPMHAIVGDVPGSLTDFSFPPLDGLPDLPSFPIILPGGDPVISEDGPGSVLVHDVGTLGNNGIGLVYTSTFDTDDPEWYTVNGGLTEYQYKNINRIMLCPNGALYVGRVGGNAPGGGDGFFLARAPYIGGAFTIIEDRASLNAKYSQPSGDNIKLATFQCNPLASEEVVYLIYPLAVSDVIFDVYLGDGSSFANTMTMTGVYNNNPGISYGNGKWLMTHGKWPPDTGWHTYNPGLTAEVDSGAFGALGLNLHTRLSTSGTIIHHDDDGSTIAISTDNMTDITREIGGGYGAVGAIFDDSRFAIDLTGQYLMTKRGTGGGKSSDYGSTLVDNGLPVLVDWRFAYAGGASTASRWVAAGTYIYYSDDFGANWTDKQGNLPTLNSLFKLDCLKIVEF